MKPAIDLTAGSISLALVGLEEDATRAKSAGLLQFVQATSSLVAEGSPVLSVRSFFFPFYLHY